LNYLIIPVKISVLEFGLKSIDIESFKEVYQKGEIERYSNSYLPKSFQEEAKIKK